MNVLLDTHVLLWWFTRDARVSAPADAVLTSTDNRIYVSAAVAWEVAIKTASGKLAGEAILSDFQGLLLQRGFRRLAISTDHAIRAGLLPQVHRDPFDRMLAAQSQALNFPILSADPIFDRYGVQRIW